MIEFFKGNPAVFVASLALLVSVCSAVLSFINFRFQRRHNIKMVKPILHVGQWDYENRLYVTLKNVGSGIAMVRKMTIYNAKGEAKTCIYDWLPPKLPPGMNYKEYWTPYTEFVVQASEIINLIEVPCDIEKPVQIEMREKIRRILGQLTVEVIYEDIYENRMPVKKMQLAHFLRLDNVNTEKQD